MNPIAILPNLSDDGLTLFSAVNAERKATGRTAGEALDALTSQSTAASSATPVIVQRLLPDEFFSEAQRARLSDLMIRWQTAREKNTPLSSEEQAELERLIDQEVIGTAQRSNRIEREFELTRLRDLMLRDLKFELNKDKKGGGKLDLASFIIGVAVTICIPAGLMSFYFGSLGIATIAVAAIGSVLGAYMWRKD